MKEIPLITSEKSYNIALECTDELMDAKPGTAEFIILEFFSKQIAAYEDEHYPIGGESGDKNI